jgi:hypothetical protein
MKSIDGRISKLERRFGISDDRERFVVILDGVGSTRALSNDRCIQILDEPGLLHTSGFGVVDLTQIPNGLSAKETERFLRESGDRLSGSRRVQSPSGPGMGCDDNVKRQLCSNLRDHGIEPKDINMAMEGFEITLSE